MDLRERVMDILEGRAKMGAGVQRAGRKTTKKRVTKPAPKTATKKRKTPTRAGVLVPRGPPGPIQEGLSGQMYRGRGRQVSKSQGGTCAQKKAAAKNPWIKHVKKVQKQTGLPYKEAMVVASKSYKKPCKTATTRAKATTKPKTKKAPAKKPNAHRAKKSPWIQYVKDYARMNNITYSQALCEAGPSYHAQA